MTSHQMSAWVLVFLFLLATILVGLVAYDWNCRGKKQAYDAQRDCVEKCQDKCSEHGRKP